MPRSSKAYLWILLISIVFSNFWLSLSLCSSYEIISAFNVLYSYRLACKLLCLRNAETAKDKTTRKQRLDTKILNFLSFFFSSWIFLAWFFLLFSFTLSLFLFLFLFVVFGALYSIFISFDKLLAWQVLLSSFLLVLFY